MLNINVVISTFYLYLNLRDVKDPYHVVMKRYVKIMYAHLSTITYLPRPAVIYYVLHTYSFIVSKYLKRSAVRSPVVVIFT